MNEAQPTWCNRCGERFNRITAAASHICSPNDTGFNPGDPVRVDGVDGQVQRVSRGSAEVYFRSCFRSAWYPATQLERAAS